MKTLYHYFNLNKESEGYFEDKGSKFYAYAYNVYTENDVKKYLEKLKEQYPKATHHCYAYRIGTDKNNFRANDDGEPSGSAGRPILGQIDSFGLSNVLCVVVRFYGGTNLGVSGLINAYKKATQNAFENAKIIEKEITQNLKISCTYTQVNDLFNHLKSIGVDSWNETYNETCNISFEIPLSIFDNLEQWLNNNNYKITNLDK